MEKQQLDQSNQSQNQQSEYLHNLRHSAAHLLAHAVCELFPGTKLTIGPVTEYGFFYDFLPTANFKEEDLDRIEAKMRDLALKNYAITGNPIPKNEARELFKDNHFKQELIDGVDDEKVGVYYQGDFYDLCRGGHVERLGEIKHFKLTGISGSYWRADREGTALQRISGVAFATEEELQSYLDRVEQAKLNDHRRLGKQLDLFSFHDEAPGVPFFHDRGLKLYNGLIEYMRKLRGADYFEVKTPMMMNETLWHQSGHYDNYKEHMYFCSVEEQTMCVRPMNCPGSILLYRQRPRSYRELPLRMAEFGNVHRYELSGVMHGLFRVRSFTIDDAHIYCTPDQVENEIAQLLSMAQKVYEAFSFKSVKMGLSTRPEKSIGSDELWNTAINALKNALEKSGQEYILQEGEGAFYGPKIEIKIEDTMGRWWQCGTIQVDFFQGENFDLSFVDSNQERKRPVIIHQAMYGSIERFLGIVLEHLKGHLPFWCAPVQARVLTITDHQAEYAKSIVNNLLKHGVRAEQDISSDQISAQIRRAQEEKIPWMLVVGKKEVEQGTITLRKVDGKQEFGLTLEALIERAKELQRLD